MSEKYLKYVARDFFVVMPVGANLDQLESNGYFDGSTTYKPMRTARISSSAKTPHTRKSGDE